MLKGMGVHSYYAGGFVYKANKTLDYILHAEGVIRATDATGGQTLGVEYFLRDHLGNTRVVFNSSGAVLQTTDYYPFGKEHTPLPISNGNRYLYNGKEKQEFKLSSSSLDWYDYGARFYDPAIARWHTPDPLCEVNRKWSPYRYAYNNPLRFIDPDGMLEDNYDIGEDGSIRVERTEDKTNTYTYHRKDGSTEDLGTYEKNENNLVQLPASGTSFVNNSEDAKSYVNGDMAAGILGASMKFYDETGIKVQINQLTTSEGGHSGHDLKIPGTNADVRYVNKDGNVNASLWVTSDKFDKSKSQDLANTFKSFGFDKVNSILTENGKGNGPALSGTYFVDGKGKFHHKHHMHLQQFNFKHIIGGELPKTAPNYILPYSYGH